MNQEEFLNKLSGREAWDYGKKKLDKREWDFPTFYKAMSAYKQHHDKGQLNYIQQTFNETN